MNNTGYCGHPMTYNDYIAYLRSVGPLFRPRAKGLMKKLLEWMPPMALGKRPLRIHSSTGTWTDMVITTCSLISEQIVTLDEEFVVGKIVKAGRIAEKKGAKVLGLGGITSSRGDHGRAVAEQLGLPVTNGHILMVATAVARVEQAVARVGGTISETDLAIVGVSEIGMACLGVLGPRVRSVSLCGGEPALIEAKAHEARDHYGVEVHSAWTLEEAVRRADAVIWTTGFLTTDPDHFKPGSVLCDIGLPLWMSDRVVKHRPDVLAFLGEVLRPSRRAEWEFFAGHGLPEGTLPSCMVEPALLVMEGRYESYSLGPDPIDLTKVEEIGQLAERHGFTTDRFAHGDREYTEQDLDSIAARRQTEATRGDGCGRRTDILPDALRQ